MHPAPHLDEHSRRPRNTILSSNQHDSELEPAPRPARTQAAFGALGTWGVTTTPTDVSSIQVEPIDVVRPPGAAAPFIPFPSSATGSSCAAGVVAGGANRSSSPFPDSPICRSDVFAPITKASWRPPCALLALRTALALRRFSRAAAPRPPRHQVSPACNGLGVTLLYDAAAASPDWRSAIAGAFYTGLPTLSEVRFLARQQQSLQAALHAIVPLTSEPRSTLLLR